MTKICYVASQWISALGFVGTRHHILVQEKQNCQLVTIMCKAALNTYLPFLTFRIFIFIFIQKVERQRVRARKGRQRKRERFCNKYTSPKMPAAARAWIDEISNLEFHPGLPHAWQESKYLGFHSLFASQDALARIWIRGRRAGDSRIGCSPLQLLHQTPNVNLLLWVLL